MPIKIPIYILEEAEVKQVLYKRCFYVFGVCLDFVFASLIVLEHSTNKIVLKETMYNQNLK